MQWEMFVGGFLDKHSVWVGRQNGSDSLWMGYMEAAYRASAAILAPPSLEVNRFHLKASNSRVSSSLKGIPAIRDAKSSPVLGDSKTPLRQ